WLISKYGVKNPWQLIPSINLIGVAAALLLVMTVGVFSNWEVMTKKPLGILREERSPPNMSGAPRCGVERKARRYRTAPSRSWCSGYIDRFAIACTADQSKSHNRQLTTRYYPLLARRRAIFSLWLSYLFFKDHKSR